MVSMLPKHMSKELLVIGFIHWHMNRDKTLKNRLTDTTDGGKIVNQYSKVTNAAKALGNLI